MGRPIKKDSTDKSTTIRIIDSTSGLPETAVEHDTSGIALWYRREGATQTSITEAALAALDSAHSDGGIEHMGDGYYRLDLPDAAWATGADCVTIGGTVTDMIVIGNEHPLVDYDPYDAVRMGMTALPNAAADAAGGLPISDAGGLDVDAILADTNELQTDDIPGTLSTNDTSVDTQLAAIKAETALIVADTNELQTDDIPGTLSTNDTSVDTQLAAIKTETALIVADTNELQTDDIPTAIAAVPTVAEIQAEMEENGASILDTLRDDLADGGRLDLLIDAIKVVTDKIDSAQAEPGQEAPAVNATPLHKLALLFKSWRNQRDNDGDVTQLYNDAGDTVDQKRTTSEAAGTMTKGKIGTGP